MLKTTGFRAKLEEISEESSHHGDLLNTGQTPPQHMQTPGIQPVESMAGMLQNDFTDDYRHSLEE